MDDLQKHESQNTTKSWGNVGLCRNQETRCGIFFLALNEQFKCEPNSKCAVTFISVGVFVCLNLSIC